MRTPPHLVTAPLLDLVFSDDFALVRPAQIRAEIAGLLDLLQAVRPRIVLEIGTANGGSLFLWTRIAAPDAQLISLDLPGGDFGDGYPRWKRPLYRAFAGPCQRIELLQADSHAPSSCEAVIRLLGRRPIDFLFIDGDHRYAGVRQDFEMYAPLVRRGGVVALHDVAEHADPACQVHRFWLEVKARYQTREFIAAPPAGWGGLGVISWPGRAEGTS